MWTSVAEMAAAIADALEQGRWAPDDSGEHDLEPSVTNGALRWEPTDEWETLGRDPSLAGATPALDPVALRAEFILRGGKRRTDAEMAEQLGVPLSTITDLRRQIESERPW
jgi:hypothetical protein